MITIIIIAVTCFISIAAFGDRTGVLPESLRHGEWLYRFHFNAYDIVHRKQYYRLFTDGFVHLDWGHLIFNMFTLYIFGKHVESYFALMFGNAGVLMYVLFYLTALCVSSLPDLLKYKDNPYYNALGASGAVSAVVFAAILLSPGMSLFIMFVPLPIPGYVYAVGYLVYSAYMARRGDTSVGHTAHFAGAVYGFVFPLLFQFSLLSRFLNSIF